MAKKEIKKNLVFKNKKAFHDFTILDSLEAGIMLEGSEVKAIREGRVNLKDSFVRIIKGEVFLLNAHISHLSTTHRHIDQMKEDLENCFYIQNK